MHLGFMHCTASIHSLSLLTASVLLYGCTIVYSVWGGTGVHATLGGVQEYMPHVCGVCGIYVACGGVQGHMPHVCERCRAACATCVEDTGVHVTCVWGYSSTCHMCVGYVGCMLHVGGAGVHTTCVCGVQGYMPYFCGGQGCMPHMWEVQGCMPHVWGV